MRLLLAATCVLAALQSAAFADDRDLCKSRDVSDATVISACGRIITSRKETTAWKAYAHSTRGWIFARQGDYDRALPDFNEAIKLNPTVAEYFEQRCGAYSFKEDFVRAEPDCNRAAELKPGKASSHEKKSHVQRKLGKYDAAISSASRGIMIDPKSARAWAARGAVYLEKADFQSAIRDFNEATAIDRRFAEAFLGRGKAYEALNEIDRARREFEFALTLPAQFNGRGQDNLEWFSSNGGYQDEARQRLSALPDRKTEPTVAPARPTDPPERRVALVIGNAEYLNVSTLPNPARDADTIASTLTVLGFQVIQTERNLGRESFVSALRRFGDEAEKADWAVVYFAGHGIEVGGTNYLVPTDAKLKADRDVADEAIALDRVLAATEGAKKLRLVILDACRDNPFVPQMRRTVASRSIGRGLASVEPDSGVLIAYAAKHGQVALDGEGVNSPFVSAFVKHIAVPNVEINKIFRLVRDDVLNLTGRRQEPYVYGSLPSEDLFFNRPR